LFRWLSRDSEKFSCWIFFHVERLDTFVFQIVLQPFPLNRTKPEAVPCSLRCGWLCSGLSLRLPLESPFGKPKYRTTACLCGWAWNPAELAAGAAVFAAFCAAGCAAGFAAGCGVPRVFATRDEGFDPFTHLSTQGVMLLVISFLYQKMDRLLVKVWFALGSQQCGVLPPIF